MELRFELQLVVVANDEQVSVDDLVVLNTDLRQFSTNVTSGRATPVFLPASMVTAIALGGGLLAARAGRHEPPTLAALDKFPSSRRGTDAPG